MKKLFPILFITLLFPITINAKLTQPKKQIVIDYSVQNGDTLYKIAHEHHTTIKEVLDVNGMNRDTVIKVGQVLKVPLNTYKPEKNQIYPHTKTTTASKAPKHLVEHTVKNGENLFTIARKYHISISSLLKTNNIKMNDFIKVGQVLVIQANGESPAGTRSTAYTKKTAKDTLPDKIILPQQSIKNKDTYIVQKGDTLFSIARKNHIIISKLMKINHIGITDRLQPGQTIRLIAGKKTFIAGKEENKKKTKQKTDELPVGAMPSYTVKKGDTLWRIARRYHLTLAQIRKLNKMSRKDRIHTGMVLAVGKAVQPKPELYIVKRGDTLWLIAKKYNMSTKKLRKINKMKRKDRIHTGMVIALTKDTYPVKVKMDRKIMIAKLEEKGAKKSEIEAVLARIRRSKKKNPDIEMILSQVKKDKKTIRTPLRIAKKKKRGKRGRLSSATSVLNGSSGSSSWSNNSRVIRVAKRYLGRRYVWGAEGPRAFDCSGFTQYVMRKSKGVRLPRVSRKQAYYGKYVSRSHLRPGDLIFFDTSRRRRGYVNHVGIYIGNHKFIHASSGRHRVVITSLNRPFYSARFKWGRRVN